MTRTKATVKRRQQRSRLEREAQKAQLREAREAEQQQAQDEEEEEQVAPQQNAENQEKQAEREEDRALVEEPIRENAREEEEEEERQQERALEEQPIKAQEDNAHEQEGEGEEEGHEEGKGGGKEEEEKEEEEGEDGNGDGDEGQLLLTDYEKQRERRLKENATKLAALNLPTLASSFGPPMRPQRQSSKKKSKKDDDYMPSSSSDSEDSDDNNEEGAGPSSQQDVDGDYNEDQALQEAITLSLAATADNVIGKRSKVSQTRKGKRKISDRNDGAKKMRKGRQEQFTSDEIAAIFSLIDERGNGKFSVAEVERIARSHDFTWSKQEISDMIDIFDSNKDGQLDLSEFQGIFGRMNMLKMNVT